MEFLKYFWRGTPDPGTHMPPPAVHALLAAAFVGLIALTFLAASDKKRLERLIRVFTIALLAEVVITNAWYWTAPYLAYPLPLYHCRIAKIILIVFGFWAAASGKTAKALKQYACCVAFYGAISAYVYPVTDPFDFPHVSLFSFYVGHMLLGVLAIALLLRDGARWRLKDLIPIELVILPVNVIIFAYDARSGINYSYMLEPPFLKLLPREIGLYPYALGIFAVYGILAAISYLLLMKIQQLSLKRERSGDYEEVFTSEAG